MMQEWQNGKKEIFNDICLATASLQTISMQNIFVVAF
jgi:hypothetical protein